MDFYTSVLQDKGKILFRGYDKMGRVQGRVDFSPSLFLPETLSSDGWTTIRGEPLRRYDFPNIRSARDFINKYEGISSFRVFGSNKFHYTWIHNEFPGQVPGDFSRLKIGNIDIEVGSENGFPEPDVAQEEITAITIKSSHNFMVFGCGEYSNSRTDVTYVKCTDERDLILQFLTEWEAASLDIVTGWSVRFFDIPYLVNRITRLFGDQTAKRLSPWNIITQTSTNFRGKDRIVYSLAGVATLDYVELYRKFAEDGMSQESYRLDHICQVEIGEGKLDYSEYETLHLLYKLDYQKFIAYNIRDVELVEKLDKRLHLLSLAVLLAWFTKSNFEDVFKQTRMWDNITTNYLWDRKVAVDPMEAKAKSPYSGAWVKDPVPGFYRWIVSFDLTSLYPHLIMQFGISPDTMVDRKPDPTITVDKLLDQEVDLSHLKQKNWTVTPNGMYYRNDKKGFLPEIMGEMFDLRKKYKDLYLAQEQEYKNLLENDPNRKAIEYQSITNKTLQNALKTTLNSAYGALGSQFFRFFDERNAEAITSAGRLVIQWVIKDLNILMNKLSGTKNIDYVIAADTDSCLLTFDAALQHAGLDTTDVKKTIHLLDKMGKEIIQPELNRSFAKISDYLNCPQQKMNMKREIIADTGFWTAKKRYALNVWSKETVTYEKAERKIVGLETERSSVPTICREKLEEFITIILQGSEKQAQKFISDFENEFRKLEPWEIAFPRGVHGLETYYDKEFLCKLRTPIHVRASLVYNDALKKRGLTKKYPIIKEAEKIKFLYLREPNILNSHVVGFIQTLPEEFDILNQIDYNTQFEKTFLEPAKTMLSAIGWAHEENQGLFGEGNKDAICDVGTLQGGRNPVANRRVDTAAGGGNRLPFS